MENNLTEESIEHRIQFYKDILSRYAIGESLKGKDFDAGLDLLKQHPNADGKIGVGIKDLMVDDSGYGGPGSKCFHLVRHDGTKDNFSYLKCLGYNKNIRQESNKPQGTTQSAIIKTYRQPIKQKHSVMVSESKPTAQPKKPKPQQPQQVIEDSSKKQVFFLRIGTDEEQGERLMFRMRSGEIVEGIITDEKSGFVKLTDAVIIDKALGTISKVKWIRMERTQIAHFGPLPTEIKMIEPVS